jgi:hypothetical protein
LIKDHTGQAANLQVPSQQTVPSAQIKDAPARVLPLEVFGYWPMNVSRRREESSCGLVRQKPVEVVVVVDRLRSGLRSFGPCHGLIVTNPVRKATRLRPDLPLWAFDYQRRSAATVDLRRGASAVPCRP